MTTIAQQIALDNALVTSKKQHRIGKCNMRINPGLKPKEPTYQVFWATINKHNASYRFKIDNKRFFVNVEVFREILNIYPKILGQVFDETPFEEETLSFIKELGHFGEIKYITDVSIDHLRQPWRAFAIIINKCLSGKIDNKYLKKQDKMFYTKFTKAIIHHFLIKYKSILMRNRMFMHTARDDSLLGTMRFVSIHEDTQVYGALLPKSMMNQAMLDSDSYKTYYAIATGVEPPKPKKTQKKSDLAISSEETPSKKKPAKAKKDVPSTKKQVTKPRPTKKKAPVKADRGKGLNVLSEVALSEAAQLKKISSIDERTGTKPGVPDVPKYDSKSKKESWGNSGEEDNDDEDDTEDESDNDGNDNDSDNDGNDDDGDNDDNNDDKHEEEEEEYVDELTDEEDNADNEKEENEEEIEDAEELYRDVYMNLRKEDVEMTDADQGGADQHNVSQESRFEHVEEDAHVTLTPVHDTQKTERPMQSSYLSSDFTDKLINFENASPADNEIASLMDTTIRHEEPSRQTSFLYTIPVTVIPEITSTFTITIHPLHPSFNPLPHQVTPTPTPTASEITTSFPTLFSSVFKFNDRVTNLEKDLSEMKQVDQYAQAISSIPAIVDRYINNKLGEAIQQAIKSYTAECREKALADKREYIDVIDTSVRAIIKEEILPQAVLDFATPVIKQNVTESLEAAILAKSSSQPKSTYAAAASLLDFELTKILMDKMQEHKSYLRADYKRELYDALVKSYNTDKDLFETYGEIFTLKRSQDEKDKDQDPFARSD
ncbi:hypothetical protein Tco_0324246 [Tanacetum coccineum]